MVRSVAVVTRRVDASADLVVVELERRGVPVFRFDLAEFPARLVQAFRLSDGASGWSGVLCTAHRQVRLGEVGAVWYRKPTGFEFDARLNATEHAWAAAEAKLGLGGALMAVRGVRWVNPPHAAAAAEPKPAQLAVAAECGLAVPDTLITNDPGEARAFCAAHDDQVLYKPLSGAPPRGEGGMVSALYARSVSAAEVTETVAATAHLFQQRVPRAFEARVVTVGRRMFAARIDAPGGTLDWRTLPDAELTYTDIEVPTEVAAGLRRVMDAFGLVYSSSDWVVTPTGEWVFIGDLNPAGQWAWIPQLRDPVASALADELTGGETQ